ncbi:MAG: winged helix-turn-helix transcriptional regulator [Candidatus Rokubacteria bacterium]|nr:winged helix-turn-helix transcriptional regulator [Candidatus Rokubacteria bacterium]MBI3107328.1 winged helix-turn-helix transcriptional regulator [Candidatus Rokubacteria bacterium]
MVKYRGPLDSTFAALADPTRRAILERLARGEAPVTELAAPFEMSLPAISKHLPERAPPRRSRQGLERLP